MVGLLLVVVVLLTHAQCVQSLNRELVSPDCVTPLTVEGRLQLYLGVPLFILIMVWVVVGTSACVCKLRAARKRKQGVDGDNEAEDETEDEDEDGGEGGSNGKASVEMTALGAGRPLAVEKVLPEEDSEAEAGKARRCCFELGRGRCGGVMVQRGLRASAIVCFIAYLTVSREAISSFGCTQVGEELLLNRDLSVSCTSAVSECGGGCGGGGCGGGGLVVVVVVVLLLVLLLLLQLLLQLLQLLQLQLLLGVWLTMTAYICSGIHPHLHSGTSWSDCRACGSVGVLWPAGVWAHSHTPGRPLDHTHLRTAVCHL